jgi:hypothetical protein
MYRRVIFAAVATPLIALCVQHEASAHGTAIYGPNRSVDRLKAGDPSYAFNGVTRGQSFDFYSAAALSHRAHHQRALNTHIFITQESNLEGYPQSGD